MIDRPTTDRRRSDRRLALLALALAGLPWPWAARAQADYPAKPITIVVPFGPGGIADLTARTVAQAMSQTLKQPIVVDNKPGAGAIVGSQAVAQAAPDGYTLLLMSNANAVSASLFKKLPFDATRDFAPVGLHGRRQELAVRADQGHGEVLFPHAFRRVADRGHEGPRRRIHPAEVSGIENDPRRIAVAPIHLARKAVSNRGEFIHRSIISR